MDFKERLRMLVNESGKSYIQIGKESGVSKASIAAWCRGEGLPNSKALSKICLYFGVSADWLLGISDFKRLRRRATVKNADGGQV